MHRILVLTFLMCATIGVQPFSIPDNVKPCQRHDGECLTKLTNTLYKSAVEGDAALGIDSSDPIHQDLIEGKLSILTYTLINTTNRGFKKCEFSNVKLSPKSTLSLNMYCPELVINGDYEIDGRLIVLPIQGKGPFIVHCKDYYIHLEVDINKTPGNDGKVYWSIRQFSINAELRGGLVFDMQNLFNGRKDLAEPVLLFARENWKEVAVFLQGPVFNANLKKIVKNFNEIFKSIPVEMIVVQ